MRKLTIIRRKTFVGSLCKLKVYIEDHEKCETKINGVPCRKLGKIANGKQESFEIENNSAKVFVIADSLSKNYCNDFYILPEGETDIYLSGICQFNPASGNAFRFDANNSEEAKANRKKGSKVGLIILIVAMVVGFVAGFVISFLGM